MELQGNYMRIAFLDTIFYDYVIETVYQKPLGGSSSAICYLAEELAKQGQEVFLLNRTTTPGLSRGVMCLPFATLTPELRHSLDVLVVVNMAGQADQIRQVLNPKTRLILWSGHAHDQPFMQDLHHPEEQQTYDGIALVSEWQRQHYHQHFGIEMNRMQVLRNAIAPAFRDHLKCDRPILAAKSKPPILVYTSTPFRGLGILLNLFPIIRQAIPGTTLRVFSSMQVYNMADTEYEPLYRQCRETEGVEYIGSISQPALAQELQSATALTYPNTFAETSCIVVMEAMASGCQIITSALGALPETTAGFAHLIPFTGDWNRYAQEFLDTTIAQLSVFLQPDNAHLEDHLRQQVTFVNQTYTWATRAQEWVKWLETMER
jgi:glycosyltransferase involved in cell wall biosynthesis